MGVVDEVTRAFHEANQYRHDHLRKAIGAFAGNLTDGDALEKARSKTGRYADTSENRKLGRVGMPYKEPKFKPIKLPNKKLYQYTVEDFNSGHEVEPSDLSHGDVVIVHVNNGSGYHSYSVGKIVSRDGDSFEVKIDGLVNKIGGKYPNSIKIEDIRLLRKVKSGSYQKAAETANKVRSEENERPGEYGIKKTVSDGPKARELKNDGSWSTED